MNARFDPEEARDEAIAQRAAAIFNAQRAAILAGDKPTTKEVRDQIIDYVAAASMPGAMTDRTSVTQQWFAKFAQAVMRDNAELEAIAQIEKIEGADKCGLDVEAMQRAPSADNAVRAALRVLKASRVSA